MWHSNGAKRSLKMFAKFMNFISPQYKNTYEMSIVTKLADNEPSGCRLVVYIIERAIVISQQDNAYNSSMYVLHH